MPDIQERKTPVLTFIRELYHMEVRTLNTPDEIRSYVSSYQYHKKQSAITEENLYRIILEYPDDLVLLTDSFFLRYFFLTIEGSHMILGPFSTVSLSSPDVRILLERNHIHDLTIQDFFSYYNSFPVFTESFALQLAESLCRAYGMETIPSLKKLTHIPESTAGPDSEAPTRENSLRLLEKRYAYERRFIEHVEKGNYKGAMQDLRNMEADVRYLKQLGKNLDNEKIGAAITRTTVRIAAMQANLPVYLIDEISRENTIATFQAKTADEVSLAKERMIRSFCSAIKTYHDRNYSSLVQSILYYFEHDYHREITLDHIAAELEVSKKHIISEFRAQTGTTPMAYLRTLRLKNASVLLSGTGMSIQDISDSVGIPDANYFTKLFKNEYGLTPQKYRNRSGTV